MNVQLPMRLLEWIGHDKINWYGLSRNPSPRALQLLEDNPDKINWFQLSENQSERALQLLEDNPDKINWYNLSFNPSPRALQLLKKNTDKINWDGLFRNPHIFKYDYEQMKYNCMLFKEDLMKNRFHPRNLSKFRSWGTDGFNSDSDDDES